MVEEPSSSNQKLWTQLRKTNPIPRWILLISVSFSGLWLPANNTQRCVCVPSCDQTTINSSKKQLNVISTLRSNLLETSGSSAPEVFLRKFHGHLTFSPAGHDAPLPPQSFLMGFGSPQGWCFPSVGLLGSTHLQLSPGSIFQRVLSGPPVGTRAGSSQSVGFALLLNDANISEVTGWYEQNGCDLSVQY